MEITIDQVNKIDRVLNYLLEKSSNKIGSEIATYEIENKLGIDEDEVDHLFYLLSSVIEFKGEKVINEFNNTSSIIGIRHNTAAFVQAGGAIVWFNKLIDKQKKEQERETLEEQKLRAELKAFRIKKWQFWLTFGIAAAALILSIINYFWPNS